MAITGEVQVAVCDVGYMCNTVGFTGPCSMLAM